MDTRSKLDVFPLLAKIQHTKRLFNSQPIQTLRELGMVKVMEDITDIEDWYRKVMRLSFVPRL